MRNRDAARYAAWAGIAAGAVVLVVVGFYVQRGLRDARARRAQPSAVSSAVQQQSAQFSFSKVEQNRTLFTVRASRATQFKEQNRAVLEDVWITVYGAKGDRNDNVHTRECSYSPDSGDIRCEGPVQIDIAPATASSGASPEAAPGKGSASPTVQVTTSNLSFNRNTGEASTPAPVNFRFSGGQGSGVGVSYSESDSVVRLQHDVEFSLAGSERTGGMPVTATGSAMDIRRDQRDVVLEGPAVVRQGNRELAADRISVELDSDNRARTVIAEGHPQIHGQEGGAKIAILAQRIQAALNPGGWAEHIAIDGPVNAVRESSAGADHFSAAKVEIAMLPGGNLAKDLTATGNVVAESQQGGDTRTLKTEALRVSFTGASSARSTGKARGQRVENAETLAPATIVTASAADTTTLAAKKFVAGLGPGGRLEKLYGHGGVDVQRQIAKQAPQTISAAEMIATFTPSGEWNAVDESGGVHFQQADRQVTAAHANFVRSTNVVTLDGSPVLSDSESRTSAANVVVDQQSGEVHATGGVISTYVPASQGAKGGDSIGLGAGAAHISADALTGSINSGHALYAGHARLWQGDSVLDADHIELWRDDKHLLATGHVTTVFSQAGGPLAGSLGQLSGAAAKSTSAASPAGKAPSGAGARAGSGPALWRVTAPSLAYWSDQGKARLEGGVFATSSDGSLESRTMDVYLGPGPSPAGSAAGSGSRQLSRVLAQGGAVVRQGDRRGAAEQAEYTAADGKFVLSGGQATVTDAASNTATGRSLTFFVADDTILLDSQEGSRTLTRHRVEK